MSGSAHQRASVSVLLRRRREPAVVLDTSFAKTSPILRTQRLGGFTAATPRLRGLGAPISDVRTATVAPLADGQLPDAVRRVLHDRRQQRYSLSWPSKGGRSLVGHEGLATPTKANRMRRMIRMKGPLGHATMTSC